MNTQITEDYCSFEVAKLLKEKGFDELTCGFYYDKSIEKLIVSSPNNYNDSITSIATPSQAHAMKWLREIHHCVICIIPLTFYCGEIVSKWGYCIWADDNIEVDEESSPRLESYEEACEAAIKYCLTNLI